MTYKYIRTNSNNRSTWDTLSSERLNNINEDLDLLFERLDDRNLNLSYDINDQLTQIIDTNNSITIDIDRSEFDNDKLYIQEQWDAKKYTIIYNWNAPDTITYA